MAAKVVITTVVVVVGWLLCGVEGKQPVLHNVGGGKYTWTTNINFTDWSIHEHFYVGDWLCEFFFPLNLTMTLCYLNRD